MLEDHADVVACLPQPWPGGCHVPAVHRDSSGVRMFQRVDGADQGALAGAALAHDAENLAAVDGQRHVVKGPDRVAPEP